MAKTKIVLCGAGALGSWAGLFLASPDIEFLIVDDDRVDDTNVPVSVFGYRQIGKPKAVALAELTWLKSKCEARTHMRTLIHRQPIVKFQPHLCIDAFDNVAARGLLVKSYIPTLHVGVSDDRSGIAVWDEHYTLPSGPPRGEDPFCTHHAGRAIIRMTAAVAAGVVEEWMSGGIKGSVVVMENGVRLMEGAIVT